MVFLETTGHWIHQERPAAVNPELVAFLKSEMN
jgi:pimeloyl-ACP methyl ester carboxylesterase